MIQPLSAYWTPEKFEAELLHELGPDFHSRVGHLFLSSAPYRDLVFAHTGWKRLEKIEISSITDAGKKLRERGGTSTWALAPMNHIRRSVLIEEQLGNRSASVRFKKPLQFLEKRRPNLAEFGLVDSNLMYASAETTSWIPQGEPHFEESPDAPSRAYLKLWELFTVEGFAPSKGQKCLDLGASPGGWTWVLASLGAHVTSVDKAELAPHVARMPHVQLLQRDAFKLKPSEVGALDWFFSDVICEPRKLLSLVQGWRESGLCKNFVCSIKFKGQTDFGVLGDFLKIEGSRARHLFHNKHEVTWWLVEPRSLA